MKELFSSFPAILAQFKSNTFKIIALLILVATIIIVIVGNTKVKESGCSGLINQNNTLTSENNNLMNQNLQLTTMLTKIQQEIYKIKPDTIVGTYEQPHPIVMEKMVVKSDSTSGDLLSMSAEAPQYSKPKWNCSYKKGNKKSIINLIDSMVKSMNIHALPNSK